MSPKVPFREMLLRSPLLADMDHPIQDALLPGFDPVIFDEGDPIVVHGKAGHALLVLLAGTVDVYARSGDRRFKVITLHEGDLFGEVAFFDSRVTRSADVVASSRGLAAALPYHAYRRLAKQAHPAAAVLERVVMARVAQRLEDTNQQIAILLAAHKTGGLVGALGRVFGIPTPTPGVNDG